MAVLTARFPSPVLGEGAPELFTGIFGDNGAELVEALRSGPDEAAVLSMLAARLLKMKGGVKDGLAEDGRRDWTL